MAVDRTKGTPDGARAGVAATKAWLVARLSDRRCKVASRCSCVEPGGHWRPLRPTALDADKYTRDYHSRPIDHDGLVFDLGRLLGRDSGFSALSSARSRIKSQDWDRGPVVADNVDSYQVIAPGHNTQAGDDHNLRPKLVPAPLQRPTRRCHRTGVWPKWGG